MNAHSVAKFLLSKAVRDSGIRVVMTGEGADEVFAGYPFFRRDLVLHNMDGQDPDTRSTCWRSSSGQPRLGGPAAADR